MDNHSKYLKYKIKYLKLKNLNQTGGKNTNQDGENTTQNEHFYFGQNTVDNMDSKKPTLYLFKANWCGHCKNFKETWNSLGKKYNNNINFISYDADKNQKAIKEWNVNGFPHLIARTGTNAKEYNGDRDVNSLVNYIESLIKKP